MGKLQIYTTFGLEILLKRDHLEDEITMGGYELE
jgi:hypothetical protein